MRPLIEPGLFPVTTECVRLRGVRRPVWSFGVLLPRTACTSWLAIACSRALDSVSPRALPSGCLYLSRARTAVPRPSPRTLLGASGNEVTDSDKAKAYDSFIANSGTYEISESGITARPVAAKVPGFTTGSQATIFSYRADADSLWPTLENVSLQIEPMPPKSTTKLVRSE